MNRFAIKSKAKEALKGNWKTAVLSMLIYEVIWIILYILISLFGSSSFSKLFLGKNAFILAFVGWILMVIVVVAAIIVTGNMNYGITKIVLNLNRNKEISVKTLFDGFKDRFVRNSLVELLISIAKALATGIFTFIGLVIGGSTLILQIGQITEDPTSVAKGLGFFVVVMLICVIAGAIFQVVVVYALKLAFYVRLDNPDLTAFECLKKTVAISNRHKLDLFVLELSFIGWDVLSICTLGILYLWVMPYKKTAEAAFYEMVIEENAKIEKEA